MQRWVRWSSGGAQQIFVHIGQYLAILMPEPHKKAHQSYIDQYMMTQRPKILGESRETRLYACHKDGGVFPIMLIVDKFEVGGKTCFSGIVRSRGRRSVTSASQ